MRPFDLKTWAETNAPEEPEPAPQKPARGPRKASKGKGDRHAAYATNALEMECQTLSATTELRNNTLNRAAVAMGELVAAGYLNQSEVENRLTEAALQTGLPAIDVAKTLASGMKYGLTQPRYLGDLEEWKPAEPALIPGGQVAKPAEEIDCRPNFEENPHRLATTFLREKFGHRDGTRKLRFWANEFHSWEAGAYRFIHKDELKAHITKFLELEFERIHTSQMLRAAVEQGDEAAAKVKPIPVTTNLVGHVLQALSGETLLSTVEYPEQPCWIDGEVGHPIQECIPMKTGILHLPSYAEGLPSVRKSTPRLFCGHALNYDFDPDAPEPKYWLEFLGDRPISPGSPIKNQVWDDDPESIMTLQEWIGLNMVPDIRFQKMMAFIGAKRAGKGTIGKVMEQLVGSANFCGPTIDTFEDTFGLQDFVGKLTAIFDDVRIGPKTNHSVVAGRLLTISGGGSLTVRRMHRKGWTGRLTTRITMMSNMVPRFNGDETGVLADRFIILNFRKSFFGQEDLTLDNIFKSELPGIMKWAIEGWKRLQARGRFIQPKSGLEESSSMKNLASPIHEFVEECCEIGSEKSATCANVFAAWRQWCEAKNIREAGTETVFGRTLHGVVNGLVTKQVRTPGTSHKPRHFVGLDLKIPDALMDGAPQTEPTTFDFGDTPF